MKILLVPGGFVAFFMISPNKVRNSNKLILPLGIVSNSYPYRKDVSLVNDYLPEPPTPTNKACPLLLSNILLILLICITA